ncbi:hypothetical protein UMM65_15370 [Aureibaculum sp. 2210JD6-5]|uniref:hypothetical protein n=1 Tax=Aureibaculum sp. 2210JD6-5 TaxID=3103957 RepID=UPI002AAEF5BD|nr:hypothetical protein [Aureibaculum sp. 2210JD6-5]MDY7396629.1 hypothetical protein [Aureibaculum sp. 2210JD6-5]
MMNLKTIKIVVLSLLFASCATTVKFPISDLVPAAEISATKKQDSNNNYTIKVTAENLASPDRLDPPRDYYVVWGVTEDNGVKNLGLLSNKNAKKVELETITPFSVKEIFITAEKEGNISEPSNLEITRKKL